MVGKAGEFIITSLTSSIKLIPMKATGKHSLQPVTVDLSKGLALRFLSANVIYLLLHEG